MDEIENFFNINEEFKRVSAPLPRPIKSPLKSPPRSIKRERDSPGPSSKKIPKPNSNCDDLSIETTETKPLPEDLMFKDELEITQSIRNAYLNVDDGVYSQFEFNLQRDTALPIYDAKEEIIAAIQQNPVVIVEGHTGCGKTTQVPQYILDDAYQRKEYCKIVCTQPRRIAAISISQRVSKERNWKDGTVVGYQVGLHGNAGKCTRLLYCTTGVLLQKLINEKTLLPFTHIILDEVHERDQDMDFLLIIIRRLLITNSKHVKIILMSATIDTKLFSNYFFINKKAAPIIKCDKRRLYQVREYYLDDLKLVNTNNADVSFGEPDISADMYYLALKILVTIDGFERQEYSLDSESEDSNGKGSVLVFLPGINEIEQMGKKIVNFCENEGKNLKLTCLFLHSIISSDDQARVFHRPQPGYRKVVLATNIAESSITVPDVRYVIDFCLTKILVTDSSTSFTNLRMTWASKANCCQRAGRAGRVSNGRVYRLISRQFYEQYLVDFTVPEMARCPLENVVLNAKLLDMGSPPTVLGLALTPPNLNDIHNTILTLKEVGGLYKYTNGVYMVDDGDISFMGRAMAALPLNIRLTRLIILGFVFGVLDDTIIMAAGLSVRPIFKFGTYRTASELMAYMQKIYWADGSGSDLIAIVNAYRKWLTVKHNEQIEYNWGIENFISLRSIREMHLLISELYSRLAIIGIKTDGIHNPPEWQNWEKSVILKSVIAGAFYPNYFVYSKLNDPDRERRNFQTLRERNPCRTVYFTNFDRPEVGQIYTRSIKELFKVANIDPMNMDVSFPANSEKVLVTFKDVNNDYDGLDGDAARQCIKTPGAVCIEVYKALRLHNLNISNVIDIMDSRSGIQYAEEHGLGFMEKGTWKPVKCQQLDADLVLLPSVFQKSITGCISHIESCSKFFVQPLSDSERIEEINSLLNNPFDIESCKFPNPLAVSIGMIVAAPFEGKYHRAKVLKVLPTSKRQTKCKVLFIDYGNTSFINYEDLCYLSDTSKKLFKVPPRIFECRLAMVEPSALRSSSYEWAEEAMEYLQEYADSGNLEIEIYSLVDGVANVFIHKDGSTANNMLVEKGLARTCDECYMSKSDHDYRMRKQSVANRFRKEDHVRQNDEYLRLMRTDIDFDITPPAKELCTKTMKLKGPFSPLEMNLTSILTAGSWKSVHIEQPSVNWDKLDIDPKDMYERLIVAADITESSNGSRLTARSTTRMPNIHGFGALMTMIFCPTMQIKCNNTKTKYVALLAGLGYEEDTYRPLYKQHDIALSLDVDILPNDVELINNIRISMDALLYMEPNAVQPNVNTTESRNLMIKIKNLMLRLLSKQRKYIDIHICLNDSNWEALDEKELLPTSPQYGKRALFPPLPCPRLYDEKFEHLHQLNMHCHELHRLRQFDADIKETTCRLCGILIQSVVQLRMHLLSQMHRDREYQIRFQPSPV